MNTNEVKKITGQASGSQMRITPDEIGIIKSVFQGNEILTKLMRKMFLPEIDPSAPIGQMVDLYRTIPTKDRTPEQIAIDLTVRNMVIDHVDQVLMQLSLISQMEEVTPEQTIAKLKQDSSK